MTFRISKMYNIRTTLFLLTTIIYLIEPTKSEAVHLTKENMDNILASNELIFVMFYTNWCKYSQLTLPIFDETAEAIAKEFPGAGRVFLGKVDCDKEKSLFSKYEIKKVPTLICFRNGQKPMVEKYTGERSVKAFTNYIRAQF
uniref:Endoplasmic reticulum resident protein 44-like n=1 Tax=Diabrotica virgifera virgifera TaxID=50390 RepID=A0A6P7G8H5_DIAVI